MDLGKHLEVYGETDIGPLREAMLAQPAEFWEIDTIQRMNLAGDRPGNAVYFYNDRPESVNRSVMREIETTGAISVLRYPGRPLFAEIDALIDRFIRPSFADCDVMRVQLAELPPGEVIEPHRDVGILTMIHRLHVPLVTHEGVKFYIQHEPYFLEEGRLYDLNNAVVHSVANESDVMRIHLLVDMMPHDVARASYHDDEDSLIAAVADWRAVHGENAGPRFRRRMRN